MSVDVTFMMYIENSSISISISVQIRAVLAVIPSCSGENLRRHINIRKSQQIHKLNHIKSHALQYCNHMALYIQSKNKIKSCARVHVTVTAVIVLNRNSK